MEGLFQQAKRLLFILAADELQKRLQYGLYFSSKHKFYTKHILKLEDVSAYEPESSGVISISKDVLAMITTATAFQPLFNANFPAKLLTTKYEYEDLILPHQTEQQLDEITIWLKHKQQLLVDWGFEN